MKLKKILPVALLCLLLCGCGSNPAPDASATLSPAPEAASAADPVSSPSAGSEWKQVYSDYLSNYSDNNYPYRFALIYLDDDDIPEIADVGSCAAEGTRILNCSNGEVHETQLRRLYFSYIPRGNLLLNNEGNMGYYSATIYSIIDGKMTVVGSGTQEQSSDPPEFDENGEVKYNYTWNGTPVTAAEYEAKLGEIFDSSLAVDMDSFYDYKAENNGMFTAAEIIDQINEL